MIVEIDGYYNSSIVYGRKCTKKALKEMYLKALSLTVDIRDLPGIFCRLYNFEEFPYTSEIFVDYVIDTDTNLIYKPRY
ncbi:hypothetical protein [Acetivibrio cellulolyticus]|uniref:hypothetical protein n=1 Tax=Acetivibrio cellulolyticus TaxID=35830 RepID=UPI0001E2D0E4|nr:hypothetical protein [Acetivibrio cellulolyticus]